MLQITINFLSRRHTTNKCWPTCVCQQCWLANSVGNQKSVVCSKSWPTMLAVYEVVRFLLANKRQTVRCDWLAVVNIMTAEWTDASCADYTNYTSPFYFYSIHDCIQTVFGRLRFHLRATKQITAAATSSSSAESRHLCHTVVQQNVVVCDTNVGQQQMLANICWSCVHGFIV